MGRGGTEWNFGAWKVQSLRGVLDREVWNHGEGGDGGRFVVDGNWEGE